MDQYFDWDGSFIHKACPPGCPRALLPHYIPGASGPANCERELHLHFPGTPILMTQLNSLSSHFKPDLPPYSHLQQRSISSSRWEASVSPFTSPSLLLSSVQYHSHGPHCFLLCHCPLEFKLIIFHQGQRQLFKKLSWKSCNRIWTILFIYFVFSCLFCNFFSALLRYNWPNCINLRCTTWLTLLKWT